VSRPRRDGAYVGAYRDGALDDLPAGATHEFTMQYVDNKNVPKKQRIIKLHNKYQFISENEVIYNNNMW